MVKMVRATSVAFALLAAVAVGDIASAQQAAPQDVPVTSMEEKLIAAGFEVRPADTPDRQEMLARLPAKHFVRRGEGDGIAYVYADPKGCNCLFVGSPDAYGAFIRQRQAERIAETERETARDYADARWDWGLWGPWGGRWSGFGFGRGW